MPRPPRILLAVALALLLGGCGVLGTPMQPPSVHGKLVVETSVGVP